MILIAGIFTVIFGLVAMVAFGLFTDYLANKIREANKEKREKDNDN